MTETSAHADAQALRVVDLTVELRTRRGVANAIDGVSLEIRSGETLGLVGESGSGKSLTSLALVGLLPSPPARILGGQILLGDDDLVTMSAERLRSFRGRRIAMILQDPLAALNPVFSIGSQLAEPLRRHTPLRRSALRSRAIELLRLMRISTPEDRLSNYPHQFSGGMRQRVVSAIALAGEPEVLIADEPTTALDVTVQAAYLDVLQDIQQSRQLAMLFITHDFGIVGDVCHTVAVMYSGRIIEYAPTDAIFAAPSHPYTKALLRSVPDVDADVERLVSIPGTPPSIYAPPSGCRFHPRCWLYEQLGQPQQCREDVPPLTDVGEAHTSACHFPAEAASNDPDQSGGVAVLFPERRNT